jgi:hypothetical protein
MRLSRRFLTRPSRKPAGVTTMAMKAKALDSGGDSEDFAAVLKKAVERAKPRLAEIEKAQAEGRLAEFVQDVASVSEQFERVQAERS